MPLNVTVHAMISVKIYQCLHGFPYDVGNLVVG